jgi:glycosyltransferase involved in cell wall biosynthesis
MQTYLQIQPDGGRSMPRIAIVANKVTPYRSPVFENLSRMPDVALQVIFCSEREPDRRWDLPPLHFDHIFLRERFARVKQRYIHHNPDVLPALKRFSPDVVVTTGFNPTQLYSFGYACMKRVAHVPFTDGTYISEQTLSGVHKAVRRFVYARSAAFVSASLGGQRLYESYGIQGQRCFRSCLAVNNGAFSPHPQRIEKRFDFIFSGRIEAVKNPLFALNVGHETAKRLRRKVSILFVGDGSERRHLQTAASTKFNLVEPEFHGFATQKELPSLYRSARLLLFPTLWDPWGVVVNEACAAGLPVMASHHAGVAGELVRNGENGLVCELDVDRWADFAGTLLSDEALWKTFSARSLAIVSDYSYDNAASGLSAACNFAVLANESRRKKTNDKVREADPRG